MNAEIRDLLPDLVHNRLDTAERSRVEAHVSACAACAAELSVISAAAEALANVPRVDVATVVAALPKAGTTFRRRRVAPRIALLAAAVTIAFVGVGLLRLTTPGETQPTVVRGTIDEASPSRTPSGTSGEPGVAIGIRARTARSNGLTLVGGIDALGTEELANLVAELESLEATPSGEPEPIAMPAIGVEGA